MGAAAFFSDAVRILQGPPPASFVPGAEPEARAGDTLSQLETASHLVGHCMREIESAVRALLISGIALPPKPRKPRKSKTKAVAGSPEGQDDKHLRQVRAVIADFGIPVESGPATFWLDLATSSSKQALARRAHRNNLGPPRPLDDELRKAWDSFVALLDALLDIFESRYTASVYQRLDTLAAITSPTDAQVSELKRLPYTDATHRYFFRKVTSPEWLPTLRDAGFFDQPPEPVQEEEGVRLPSWPQADFMARVAPHHPTVVREIIESVRTNNTQVQRQLVEIAHGLPIDEAVRLVPTILSWVPSLRRFEFVDPLIQYIATLSDRARGDEAVMILAALYGVEDVVA